MNRIILFLFCMVSMSSYAQLVSIDTAYAYLNDGDSCEASLVCKHRIGTSCYKNGTTVLYDDDTVRVQLCYSIGPAPDICQRRDTVCLNLTQYGEYAIEVTVAILYKPMCDSIIYSDTAYTSVEYLQTGIFNLDADALSFYPNPANDKLNCTIGQPGANGAYAVQNVQGAIVVDRTPIAQGDFSIDISRLPSGIYYLAIYDHQQRYVKKLVKQ